MPIIVEVTVGHGFKPAQPPGWSLPTTRAPKLLKAQTLRAQNDEPCLPDLLFGVVHQQTLAQKLLALFFH